MGSRLVVALACTVTLAAAAEPRTAYFADGFHGGVYGHYPPGYTAFLVDQLKANPDWKINLEIEPETWDVVRKSEPEAYAALQAILRDQSDAGRVEIVNPTYAQSYLFPISGEGVIRQFDYGIRKIREHFPNARFTTYSSEEPCFTSCLPQILKSFGFEFAVLKNPDTCWGGYTSAHGGELVNWEGPDGTAILTVPRYLCESLQPGSCWQTIAFRNAPEYIKACFAQGIEHPAGMCLQDAGWRGGPWLGGAAKGPHPTSKYITWRDYIRNVTPARTDDDWQFTQEDVKPGLMWGAQVLQRIAQQSRTAEHRLLVAEKLSAMAFAQDGRPPQADVFDEAWHHVLLTQHHDCWIVPYNGRPGDTWADQVRRWAGLASAASDRSVRQSLDAMLGGQERGGRRFARLFNPTASPLDAVVPVPIPESLQSLHLVSIDAEGRRFPTQIAGSENSGPHELLVRATIPPLGYTTVELRDDSKPGEPSSMATVANGLVVLESDLFRIEIDPTKGGTIRRLVAKALGNREFVDRGSARRFNELRGNFHEQGGFISSADQPATVTVLEKGPLRTTAEIAGSVAGNPFVQRIAITQGSPLIECSVRIDWQGHPRIGEFEEKDGWRNRRRPAYDDRFKLLVLFPVRLEDQKLAKNAPFDVCESRLTNTFYNSWDEIKNNVILNWVDVTDGGDENGLSLFSDHTTSYAHGRDFPLGLNLQYAGKGLWGRDYGVDGPTEVRYALMPHAGAWAAGGVAINAARWQEPALGALCRGGEGLRRSWVDPGESGWIVPAMFERDGNLFVRLFNASGDNSARDVGLGVEAAKIELVELDGRVVGQLKAVTDGTGRLMVRLGIPRFGIRTLRLSGITPREWE